MLLSARWLSIARLSISFQAAVDQSRHLQRPPGPESARVSGAISGASPSRRSGGVQEPTVHRLSCVLTFTPVPSRSWRPGRDRM